MYSFRVGETLTISHNHVWQELDQRQAEGAREHNEEATITREEGEEPAAGDEEGTLVPQPPTMCVALALANLRVKADGITARRQHCFV